MLRNAYLTGFLYYSCFFLSFLPLPLLALRLQVPTQQQNGNTVNIIWNKDDKDPGTFFLQASHTNGPPLLGFLPKFPFQVSKSPVEFQASFQLGNRCFGGCELCAFRDPTLQNKIACSETFTSIAITPASQSIPTTPPAPTPPPNLPPGDPPVSTKRLSTTPVSDPTSTLTTFPHTQTKLSLPTSSLNSSSSTPKHTTTSAMVASSYSSPTSIQTESPTPLTSDKKPSELEGRPSSQGVIIGAVAGCLGGLIFIALLCIGFLYYRRHRSRLPPSATHRAASDRDNYGVLDDTHRLMEQFRPELKHNTNYHAAENGTNGTEGEIALQRKAEIIEDLRFEAAARNGVKA